MPTVANSTKRRQLSELLAGYDNFQDTSGVNFHFATVDVEGTLAINPIGTPLVWDNTASSFAVYIAQDFSALTTSPLPDKTPICITVGDNRGVGFNDADVQLQATTPVKMTVLFRGDASIMEAGLDWNAGTNSTNQGLFKAKLEQQKIAITETATDVTPSFI